MCQEDNLNLQEPPSSGSAVGESKDKIEQESGQDLHSENAETTEVKVLDDMNTPMEVLLQRFKTFESPMIQNPSNLPHNATPPPSFLDWNRRNFEAMKNDLDFTLWL